MAWSHEQIRRLKHLKSLHKTHKECASLLGISIKSVEYKVRTLRDVGTSSRVKAGLGYSTLMIVPPDVLARQTHRNGLRHTDLTAIVCGDPLPGCSALDRKMEMA